MFALKEARRQAPRHRLGRLAAIQLGNGGAQHYCLVADVSEGGVRLHTNGSFEVPDDFVLRFPEGSPNQSGDYKVVWRNGLDVGAKLVGV